MPSASDEQPRPISKAILQDLVRIQGEELLRIRQKLKDAQAEQERLSSELDATLKDRTDLGAFFASPPTVDPPRAGDNKRPFSFQNAVATPPATPDEYKFTTQATAPVPSITSDLAGEPCTPSVIDDSFDAASLGEPLYFTSNNPNLYLKPLRKKLPPKTKFLTVRNDFFLDPVDDRQGYLLRPCQLFTFRNGSSYPSPLKLSLRGSIGSQRNELIMRRGHQWYYYGHYEVVSVETMDGEFFAGLPAEARRKVCQDSFRGSQNKYPENVLNDLPSMYDRGEFRVARIHMRRLCFNSVVLEGLSSAE